MATDQNEAAAERTTLTKLAERGEEAFKRLSEEIEKNRRMADARERLGRIEQNPRVADARERLVQIENSVLNRFNIASLDETEELRKQVAELEERLAKLEGRATGSKAPAAVEEQSQTAGTTTRKKPTATES
jgi:hypothetical protein